jgi:hypothetical protein
MRISTIDGVGPSAIGHERAADSIASGPTRLKIVFKTKYSQPRNHILAIIRVDRLEEHDLI